MVIPLWEADPNEPVYGPSELVEQVLTLLEEAGCPTETNDKIVSLIEHWERSQADI